MKNRNKKLTAFIASVAMTAFCGMSIHAKEAVWTGSGDVNRTFTDPGNWGTAGLPEAGDAITIKSSKPLVITDGDLELAQTFVGFYWQSSADVIWNTSVDSVSPAAFGYWAGSTTNECFIKRGSGILRFTTDLTPSATRLQANFVVEEGALRFQDYRGKTVPAATLRMGKLLAISNGATVVTFTGDTSLNLAIDTLVCRGIITNENESVSMSIQLGAVGTTSEVYSAICGRLYIKPQAGTVNLYSNNKFSGFRPVGRRGSIPQVIGLAKFGNNGDVLTPIGSDDLRYDYNGPIFRYLGTGEISGKDIYVTLHSEYETWDVVHPVTIDGGEYGGLKLVGSIYTQSASPKIMQFGLSGNHVNTCTNDAIPRIYASDGKYCPLHFVKTGSGTWHFLENQNRMLWGSTVCMIGGMSIEEGVVAVESLTDAGHASSIGSCSDCFGSYVGPYDATKRVDWAISLGSAGAADVPNKEGTLEHFGDETGYSSRAKFVLDGDGRIRSTGAGNLKLSGISAISAGTKTLTLDGNHDGTNVFCEISDGAGTVSVVKEGDGIWHLGGNLTFSGDLEVKSGTLEIEAPTNHFTWFRLTFMEVPNCDGYVMPLKIAFFDADGNHVSNETVLPDEYGGYAGTSGKRTVAREFLDLPEPTGSKGGYFLPGRAGVHGAYKWGEWGQCCSYQWFRDSVTSTANSPHCSTACNLPPTLDQEYTWFPIVIRLKSTVAKVAYYDIAAGFSAKRNPTAFMLEGSRDGFNWTQLDRRTGVTVPGTGKWYSDGNAWAAGRRAVGNGSGYPIVTDASVSSLENAHSVSVASGATLKTTYSNVGEIKGLSLDQAGAGTIDGFEFASTGTLSIVGAITESDVTIPLEVLNSSSYGNVRSWSLVVDGVASSRYLFSITPTGIKVLRRGTTFVLR